MKCLGYKKKNILFGAHVKRVTYSRVYKASKLSAESKSMVFVKFVKSFTVLGPLPMKQTHLINMMITSKFNANKLASAVILSCASEFNKLPETYSS